MNDVMCISKRNTLNFRRMDMDMIPKTAICNIKQVTSLQMLVTSLPAHDTKSAQAVEAEQNVHFSDEIQHVQLR